MASGIAANGEFRSMTYADLKRVIEIENAAYTHPWTIGIFRDCIRVGYSSWVYLLDENIIAYGIIMLAAGEAHILNICVEPQHQGKGVGRIMLRHLVEHCALTEIDMVILEVRRSNAAAAQLYQSEGFHELGVRKDYYPAPVGREDAIIFAKYVTPHKE
jgi:ribosomal-protein-alanine N-acetyltransferase